MAGRTKPGAVTAALVLLILMAVYQLVIGVFAVIGLAMPQGRAMVTDVSDVPVAMLAVGAGLALVYGVANAVLAFLTARGAPVARIATVAVQCVYIVAVIALLFTGATGTGDLIAALFAAAVAGLMLSRPAKAYFAAPTATGVPASGTAAASGSATPGHASGTPGQSPGTLGQSPSVGAPGGFTGRDTQPDGGAVPGQRPAPDQGATAGRRDAGGFGPGHRS
jgi:hypothetical protein